VCRAGKPSVMRRVGTAPGTWTKPLPQESV
jgi:hypothetical protein